MSLIRRPGFLASLLLAVGAGIAVFLFLPDGEAEALEIHVYKTPTCGCCSKWIDHLRAEGFTVRAEDLPDLTALKASHAVTPALASCHTATIDGYVVEGHVPASDIRRLLSERPAIAGLAVPGMPLGSPGMEHPDPARHQAFDVLAFGNGAPRVFARHTPR